MILHPDGVRIISKDNGVYFDMTNEDIITGALGGYPLSAFLEQKDYGDRHLTAIRLFAVRYLSSIRRTDKKPTQMKR